jgi:hypothetical protein
MDNTKTAIDEAIYVTEIKREHIRESIMLLSKERDVLSEQLDILKAIKKKHDGQTTTTH